MSLDVAGAIRVAKTQTKLAVTCYANAELLQLYLDELNVEVLHRKTRCRCGTYMALGPGDVGRVLLYVPIHSENDAELLNTLYHEFAHAICHWLFGRGDMHGPKWQAIMRRLGQEA